MFQRTRDEWVALRSQIGALDAPGQPTPSETRSQTVTLKTGRGQHRKYLPFAFTEQGVAMLSSVLRSERAAQVNIEIMRAFVRLRQILAVNADIGRRLDELERRAGAHDEQFVHVIRAIRQLMEPPPLEGRVRFPAASFPSQSQETAAWRSCAVNRSTPRISSSVTSKWIAPRLFRSATN